ncbi:MAG: ABC transporter ATP-binding protein/permease [Acholeplasmataceae bacterium]|nr:ABC transporter ATP-binding protein/permease [Acholeplasmataceae bacterium]
MIKLEQVSKYYKTNTLVAVGMRKINLDLKIGEFVAITGESGSGKSTLLNILSGLDTFEEGEFFLFDQPTSHYTIAQWEAYRSAYVGFVFQNYNIIDSYTVYQNVLLSLEFQGYDESKRKARALEIIDRVGLTHRTHHKASKLSGGEKQRTVIARALAKDCPAILCDEPTGNLDSKTGHEIIQLLHEISKDKLIVMVTHQFSDVEKYATRRVKMSDGEIIEDIPLNGHVVDEEAKAIVNQKSISLKTTTHIAFRNLFAVPKKFVFMLLLQTVFVFLAILIYGTTTSLFHQNNLLPDSIETTEHQLVVQKIDGTAFTPIEIETFENHQYVRDINKYETVNAFVVSIGRTRFFSERTSVVNDTDILRGDFPTAIDEMMVSEDVSIYLNVDIGDVVTMRTPTFQPYLATVVGITNRISKSVYFHDDFFDNPDYVFRSIVHRVTLSIYVDGLSVDDGFSYRDIVVDDMLSEGEVVAYTNHPNLGPVGSKIHIQTGYGQELLLDVSARYEFSESSFMIHINPTTYAQLVNQFVDDNHLYKLVLNVYDRFDGTRLLQSIDQDTYIIYYDALTQNVDSTSFGYILKAASYTLIVVTALLMFTLLRVVFKNMVVTRRKDFAIYRSVGASKRFLGVLILIEQVLQVVLGSIITFGVAYVLMASFPLIYNSMRFIQFLDVFIIFAVFAYMTMTIPFKFNQSIFHISVIETLTKSAEV